MFDRLEEDTSEYSVGEKETFEMQNHRLTEIPIDKPSFILFHTFTETSIELTNKFQVLIKIKDAID